MNDISFPAGILQPPFYDPRADDAVNYGEAGGVIGHELTHGYDDEGRQFDALGNLNDWWTEQDAKAVERRTQCIVDEYNQFTATDDVKVNGKLTLGENVADLGGLRLAFMAYVTSLNGQSAPDADAMSADQRFFSATDRAGARTIAQTSFACWHKPIRMRRPGGGSTAWWRTCRSSRKPSAARADSQWCARMPAGCGTKAAVFYGFRLWFVKIRVVFQTLGVLQTLKLQGLTKEWVCEQASISEVRSES